MRRIILFAIALLTLALSSSTLFAGQAEHAFRRASGNPIDHVQWSSIKRSKLEKLTQHYVPLIADLNKRGEIDRMDKANQEYSKAILQLLNKAQQTAYLEAVYNLMLDFQKWHPKVAFTDIFILGGAYAKKPRVH